MLGTADPACHSTGGFACFPGYDHGQQSQQPGTGITQGSPEKEKPGLCLSCYFGFDSALAPGSHPTCPWLSSATPQLLKALPSSGWQARSRAMCREAAAPAPSTPFQCKTQFHEEMIRPDCFGHKPDRAGVGWLRFWAWFVLLSQAALAAWAQAGRESNTSPCLAVRIGKLLPDLAC